MIENSDFAKRKEEDPYDGLSNADMSPIQDFSDFSQKDEKKEDLKIDIQKVDGDAEVQKERLAQQEASITDTQPPDIGSRPDSVTKSQLLSIRPLSGTKPFSSGEAVGKLEVKSNGEKSK